MYLLDTNIVTYFFKGMGQVTQRLGMVPPSDVAVSSITWFELRSGIIKAGSSKAKLEQLQQFAVTVQSIGFGEREAEVAASLRAELEKVGTPIGPLDTLLAGTALAHRATFVTRNVREFSRVKGLKLESWY